MRPDLSATLRHLESQRRARQEAAAKRADLVRQKLLECAAYLRQRHRAQRIWWFGSLANGTGSDRSDVDLAVEGLSPAEHMQAVAAIEAMLRMRVDLVRIEEASQSLRDRVEEEGLSC